MLIHEPVNEFQYDTFLKELASQRYWMCDPGKRNIEFLPGEKRVALIDPWAVEKIPTANIAKVDA